MSDTTNSEKEHDKSSISDNNHANNTSSIIIAIEGIDGAGKTSIINEVENKLDGISVYRRTYKSDKVKKILSSPIIQKYRFLQIPIYLHLSRKNYKSFQAERTDIIIMDRCFLSNICYFYPKAMDNRQLYKLAMLFEIDLIPQKIFIIDVDPEDAYLRNNKEKGIKWLKKTRDYYLKCLSAKCLEKYKIQMIQSGTPNIVKADKIIKYIRSRLYDT